MERVGAPLLEGGGMVYWAGIWVGRSWWVTVSVTVAVTVGMWLGGLGTAPGWGGGGPLCVVLDAVGAAGRAPG